MKLIGDHPQKYAEGVQRIGWSIARVIDVKASGAGKYAMDF